MRRYKGVQNASWKFELMDCKNTKKGLFIK
jgi:hypothetical protein